MTEKKDCGRKKERKKERKKDEDRYLLSGKKFISRWQAMPKASLAFND